MEIISWLSGLIDNFTFENTYLKTVFDAVNLKRVCEPD